MALAKPSKRELPTLECGSPKGSPRLIKARTPMTSRTFQIYRYDPDTDAKPRLQTFAVELDGSERMLVSDAQLPEKERLQSPEERDELTARSAATPS
jgi:hypothetical protein